VIPGFGVFGVSGILLILASLVMAGHTWSFDSATNMQDLTWQMGQVLFSLVTVGAVCAALARFLPSMPGFESLVLGPPGTISNEPRLRRDVASDLGTNGDLSIGERGTSLTMLRPAGKARFDNRVVDVFSDGGFIPAETKIEIVSISGRRVIVRETESHV
jgi:membrane-bound serine protease (ClpP class)